MNKIKWFALVALVFVSGSCCTPKISPSLQYHVDHFYRVAAEMGYPAYENHNLKVRFHKFGEDGPAGRCKSYGGENPEIWVNDELKDFAMSYEVEYIVFHELGHCVLGLPHDDTVVLGKPFSMMHPTMMDIKHYVKNKEAYWREMFSKPRGGLWR